MWTPSCARVTTAARRSPPSCSTSTTRATPVRSATARSRPGSPSPPSWPWTTARSGPSPSSAMSEQALHQRTWGREVVRGTVDGHPCLRYADRPRRLADLLLDARRWADRELLVQGERRLTGAEHERAVARVAAHLRRRGVGRGDRVLLLGFNRVEWVVTFWALQAIGAVAALGNAWWSDK